MPPGAQAQLFSDSERAEFVLIQIEAEVKLASHGTAIRERPDG